MNDITNRFKQLTIAVTLLAATFLSGCVTISDPIEEPPPAIFPSATPADVVLLFQSPTATRTPLPRPSATATVANEPSPTPSPTPSATPAPNLYTVQPNETLAFIAKKHAISLESLLAANNLAPNAVIQAGQQLVIPSAEEIVEAEAQKGTPLPTPLTDSGHIIHYVRAGETLSVIAGQYNVPRDDLLWANGFRPDVQLVAGDTVIVPQGPYVPLPTATALPATVVPTVVVAFGGSPTVVAVTTPTAQPTSAPRTHTVQAGEVAGVIARTYGISLAQLVSANPSINLERLSIGQVLTIPSGEAPGATGTTVTGAAVLPTATPTSVPPVVVTHVVAEGDSFASVAERYKVVEEILKGFNSEVSELTPGTILNVPLGTPTPTPTSTPMPTMTPTPAPDYMAPVPLLPANGSTWTPRAGGPGLQLLWTATGLLKDNEFYVVRLRAVDNRGEVLWAMSHWTQTPSWRVSEETLASLKGRVTLRWDVMVMRRTTPAGQEPPGGVAISNKSPTYELHYIAP